MDVEHDADPAPAPCAAVAEDLQDLIDLVSDHLQTTVGQVRSCTRDDAPD